MKIFAKFQEIYAHPDFEKQLNTIMQSRDNLEILFALLNMKLDIPLLKEICWFISVLIQFDTSNYIVDHFTKEIKSTIEPLWQ